MKVSNTLAFVELSEFEILKLIQSGTNINARDDNGYTALEWATRSVGGNG